VLADADNFADETMIADIDKLEHLRIARAGRLNHRARYAPNGSYGPFIHGVLPFLE
jgi:hypothetical protein